MIVNSDDQFVDDGKIKILLWLAVIYWFCGSEVNVMVTFRFSVNKN